MDRHEKANFKVASFNVRGLNNNDKKRILEFDTIPILKLENSQDLMLIRDIASDRKLWRELTDKIGNPAQRESRM